ncbi:hypothetical protein SK128_004170 [Halocaridina rubra]|uniref:Uncharacterized protein n=1 Tax=Halocaridina rubra TaxID=373956 RepID=A0AAN8WNM1_HALRR
MDLERQLRIIQGTRKKYRNIARRFANLFKKINNNEVDGDCAIVNLARLIQEKEEVESHVAAYDAALLRVNDAILEVSNASWPFQMDDFDLDSWKSLLTHDKYRIKILKRNFQEAHMAMNGKQKVENDIQEEE